MTTTDVLNDLLAVQGTLSAMAQQAATLEAAIAGLIVTPSLDNATVPPSTEIIDGALNQWRLEPNGQVSLDDATQLGTGTVTMLLYLSGMPYYVNAVGNWWGWIDASWQPILPLQTDPRNLGIASNGTLVSTVGPVMIDGIGNHWSIVGGKVAFNGNTTAVSVTTLLYFNGVVYMLAGAQWSQWVNNNGWITVGADPRTPAAPPPPPPPPPPAQPVGTRPYRIGVRANAAHVATDNTWMGRPVDLVDLSSSAIDGTTLMGTYPGGTNFVLTFQALLGSGTQWDLSQIPVGTYDANYISWLNAAAAFNVKVIRLLYGFSGDWAPWSVNLGGITARDGTLALTAYPPATYVSAFRHLAALIRAHLPGAAIEWSVVAGNPPWPLNPNSYQNYWPGADVVDVVGIEIHETDVGPWSTNGVLGAEINPYDILAFAQEQGKPFSIPSWDVVNGDAAFIISLGDFMDSAANWAVYHCYNEVPLAGTLGTSDQLYANAFPAERQAWNSTSFGLRSYSAVPFP